MQARIADLLWAFDEPFARDVFAWAFDAAKKLPSEEIASSERAMYAARQASALREILTRLGTLDRKRADAWFKLLEEERPEETSAEMARFRAELLIQIALQLVSSNPAQAQRLGMQSLAEGRIPDDFGSLLFALSNVSRTLSDQLFRAGLATLGRNNFAYDGSLLALVNYIFSSDGSLHSEAQVADAKLLANYLADAAWHQFHRSSTVSESTAGFYNFFQVRGCSIVSRYLPERGPELQGQISDLAPRLSPAQLESSAQARAAHQQQSAVMKRNSSDIDEEIDRASKEKDPLLRDSLLNRIAHTLMRSDNDKALKIAGMIEDQEIRAQAEDDVNLVRIQQLLDSNSYHEARKTAPRFRLKFSSNWQTEFSLRIATPDWPSNYLVKPPQSLPGSSMYLTSCLPFC